MKKEAKKKARLEERRARRNIQSKNTVSEKENEMHDIHKPITLEDLTNPDKD